MGIFDDIKTGLEQAIEYEKAITKWWKKNKTFEQSVESRPIDKSYVFYEFCII